MASSAEKHQKKGNFRVQNNSVVFVAVFETTVLFFLHGGPQWIPRKFQKKILTVYFNIHGAMIPFSPNGIVICSIK